MSPASLKGTLAGRTVYINTSYGIAVPVRYRANGTMTARAPGLARIIGMGRDSGRWWVKGNQICQKWQKFLKGKTTCFTISLKGQSISYRTSGGTRGTARIAK